MNNSLNLASKPFSNRIVPWTITVVILFVSLIGLVVVVRLATNARKEAAVAEAEINKLKQREHSLLDAAKEVKQSFSAEQQQALPAAHQLVDRKTFSWSRLLADLEASLPGNVKVSRIAVRNVSRQANQTVAQLDLEVFAESPATISEMITAMKKGGIFEAYIQNQTLQKGRGEAGTEYELSVTYRAPSFYPGENVAAVETKKQSEVVR